MDFSRPSLVRGGMSYRLPSRFISPGIIFPRFWDYSNPLRRNVLPSATLTLNTPPSRVFSSKPTLVSFGFRSHSLADARNVETNVHDEENESDSLEELRELLHKATEELEVARLNSTMFDDKAQRISETAIALKDQAASVWLQVNNTLDLIRDTVDEESLAKEAVHKATMALSLAEARLRVVEESLESNGILAPSPEPEITDLLKDKEEALLAAKDDIKECQLNLASCEAQLRALQSKKEELQKEVDKLNDFAETIQINALKAEEDVANIMKLAEQAVAFELEATQRVNDAEIALQRAEKSISQKPEEAQGQLSDEETPLQDEVVLSSNIQSGSHEAERDSQIHEDLSAVQNTADHLPDNVGQKAQKLTQSYDSNGHENGKPSVESSEVLASDSEKSKILKKQETQKDLPKEGSSLNASKASFNKSSRFFSASFFSSNSDGKTTVFASLVDSVRQQWPKLVLGVALLGAGLTLYSNGVGGNNQLLQQPDVISTSTEDVSSNKKPLIRQVQKLPKRIKKLLEMIPHQEVNEEEASLLDFLFLLLASVIFVPLFQKIPGGSPVLGYLAAGILIGPYGISIIRNVHGPSLVYIQKSSIMAGIDFSCEDSFKLVSLKAYLAEFISTLLFVFAGVGSAIAFGKLTNNAALDAPGLVAIAVCHGFALFVAVSIAANHSGGHVNPAVTFGLVLGGKLKIVTGVCYWVAQLLGSTAACFLLKFVTGGLAIPIHSVAAGVGSTEGVVMEIIITFALVYTVYATAVDPKNGTLGIIAPLAIGLIVGANILAAGPFSGGSMNPARSFGPALVAGDFSGHWVYWVGPLVGGGLAGVIYSNAFIAESNQETESEHVPLISA